MASEGTRPGKMKLAMTLAERTVLPYNQSVANWHGLLAIVGRLTIVTLNRTRMATSTTVETARSGFNGEPNQARPLR